LPDLHPHSAQVIDNPGIRFDVAHIVNASKGKFVTSIVVIGGGVIGASVAFRLAEAGARVTLLEASRLANGTSGTSFAWMNANNKAPLEYHRLNAGGMTEHLRLREEFGVAPWLHSHGNIMWDDRSHGHGASEPNVPVRGGSLAVKVARLREWNYPVDILSRAELGTTHPDLAPPDDVERIAFFPTEGYVDAPQLVANLALAARSHGASISVGQNVVDIVREGHRVVGVRTAAGDRIAADVVVSCAGRWTDQVTALTGAAVPMDPTLGLLVLSSPVAVTLRSLVHTPRVNVRPDGGSRILMASYELDPLLTPEMSQEALRALALDVLDRARVILPALKGGRVETFTVGVRALPRDSFPVIGPLPGLEGFYTIATHSGVTMGPLLGRIATREILDGLEDERVATFRPDRLFTT
jgi:glycine/D-amino acid oxidase-like deaminating enzyme